jgi:hypothetical protein
MSSLPDLTSETCLGIATMMPVFLVGLIAEKLIYTPTSKPGVERAFELIQLFLRTVVDICTAALIVIAIVGALSGTNSGGLHGRAAVSEWTLTILVVVIVLVRWVALSPGLRVPLGALFDFLLNLALVGVVRVLFSYFHRRLRSRAGSLRSETSLDPNAPEGRSLVAFLLTDDLFVEVRKLVTVKRFKKPKRAAVSVVPEQVVLADESVATRRVLTLWSVIPGSIRGISDPGQRCLAALKDTSDFSKLLSMWMSEPASLTREVIRGQTGRRLFKAFLIAERARAARA